MTKLLFASTAALLLMATAVPVHADDVFIPEQKLTEYLAKDRLIGAKVHDKDGKIVGDIEDLIVSNDNQIVGVIMGVGGFLGAGEKKVGVRYSALRFATKDGKTTVSLPSATKEVLTALAPMKRLEPKKSLKERALEKAKELTDKTKETVKDASKKAGEATKAAAEKASEAAKGAIEKGKEAVKPAEPAKK